jgi:peroxiredoxin
MDLAALSDTSLSDATGTKHRLGDLWDDQPVVLVFLRHFGCLHCREHAVQLRDRYADIKAAGGEIVAIGTGDQMYAEAFAKDEQIPFLVLVDDDAVAAHAASIQTLNWYQLLHPRTWKATWQASRRGHHVHKPGMRVKQIGATFVIGKGDTVRYEHIDSDSTDHADIDELVTVVRSA